MPAPTASPPIAPSISPLKKSASTVSAPKEIPPANAISVTRMLLVITDGELRAVAASKSRPSAGGSAAAWNSRRTSPAAAGASTAPQAAAGHRGDRAAPPMRPAPSTRPLGEPAPVAARTNPTATPAARPRVDRGPRPQHERLQPRGRGSPGKRRRANARSAAAAR